MRHFRKISLLIIIMTVLSSLIFLHGCTATVSETELRNVAKSTESETFGHIYYLGRSGGYDYFRLGWNLGEKTYRIPDRNKVVHTPMSYGSSPVLVGPFALGSWLP